MQVTGSITYNGRGFDQFRAAHTSAYVDQNDVHQPELTVRETFDFAARCQGVGHKAGADAFSELTTRTCRKDKICARSAAAVFCMYIVHSVCTGLPAAHARLVSRGRGEVQWLSLILPCTSIIAIKCNLHVWGLCKHTSDCELHDHDFMIITTSAAFVAEAKAVTPRQVGIAVPAACRTF